MSFRIYPFSSVGVDKNTVFEQGPRELEAGWLWPVTFAVPSAYLSFSPEGVSKFSLHPTSQEHSTAARCLEGSETCEQEWGVNVWTWEEPVPLHMTCPLAPPRAALPVALLSFGLCLCAGGLHWLHLQSVGPLKGFVVDFYRHVTGRQGQALSWKCNSSKRVTWFVLY